jgi:hypothetical protein
MAKHPHLPEKPVVVPPSVLGHTKHPEFSDPRARADWHTHDPQQRRAAPAASPKYLRSRGRHTG